MPGVDRDLLDAVQLDLPVAPVRIGDLDDDRPPVAAIAMVVVAPGDPSLRRPDSGSLLASTRSFVAGEPAKWRKKPLGPWRRRS
jgi:hypothetical protein